jgi:hypothetical protein
MKNIIFILMLILFSSFASAFVNFGTYYNTTNILENSIVNLNITFDSPYVKTNLTYNNTIYSPTRKTNSSHTMFTNSITTPLINQNVNLSFYWAYSNDLDDNFWTNLDNVKSYYKLDFNTTNSNTLVVTDENGNGSAFCYQEAFNTSTVCGGLNTGQFAADGDWDGTKTEFLTVDSDYSTSGWAAPGLVATVFINYSKPSGYTSALWQVKDNAGIVNLTVASECFDLSKLQFKVDSSNPGGFVNWYCLNSTGWQLLRTGGGGYDVFEEAVYWSGGSGGNHGTLIGYNFNHGTFNPSEFTTANGKYRYGGVFNGVNNYINNDNTLDSIRNNKGAISFWFNQNALGKDMFSIADSTSSRYLRFRTEATGSIYAELRYTDFQWRFETSTGIINTNEWYHVVLVHNGTTPILYLNGIDLNPTFSITLNKSFWLQEVPLYDTLRFGGLWFNSAWANYFNGTIDSVLIYNRSLSQSEVTEIYNSETKYTPIGDGLISQYAFENYNTTHAFDENNLVAGQWDEANYFDGVDDSITISGTQFEDINYNNTGYTNSIWINANSIISGRRLWDMSGRNVVETTTTNRIRYGLYDSSWHYATTDTLELNRWYNIVSIWNTTHMLIYVDGEIIDTTSQTNFATISGLGRGTAIGSEWDGIGLHFNGSIDDVLIFNRSLSSEEILRLYNHTYKVNTPTNEQQILNVEVDDCTTFTNKILNFSYFSQLDGNPINLTNNYDLTFDGYIDQTLQGTFTGNESNVFCSSINLTEYNLNYSVTGELTLTKSGWATQIFVIDTPPLIARSNPTTQQNLSLIRLNESSTILITWLTTTYEAIDGSMDVYKCNGDGSRTLITSAPVIDGDSSANIELINTPYSYEIIVNGIRYIDNSSFSRCHIETEATRQFLVDIEGIDLTPAIGLYSIDCNITRTSNTTVRMSWGTNPEDASTITGCLDANRITNIGTTLVFQNCSTGNSMDISIPVNTFSYLISGKLYQSGRSIVCKDNVEFRPSITAGRSFGLIGLFSVFFLIAGLVLLFSNEDPKWYPLAAGIALILSWLMGLVAFGWVPTSSLLAFLILIIIIGRSSKK